MYICRRYEGRDKNRIRQLANWVDIDRGKRYCSDQAEVIQKREISHLVEYVSAWRRTERSGTGYIGMGLNDTRVFVNNNSKRGGKCNDLCSLEGTKKRVMRSVLI